VAFSPDEKRIVSGSGDALKIWDATSGQETLTLKVVVSDPDLARVVAVWSTLSDVTKARILGLVNAAWCPNPF
jgi:hypothetical protein